MAWVLGTTGSARLLLSRQCLAKHCGIAGEGEPGFQIDHTILYQLCDFAVEVLHSFGGSGFYGIEQAVIIALSFSMHSRVRALALRISKAATRPLRSAFDNKRWQTM